MTKKVEECVETMRADGNLKQKVEAIEKTSYFEFGRFEASDGEKASISMQRTQTPDVVQ
jgi:hypothetical protein